MDYAAHDASAFAPPAEVGEMELYHPKTWVGKYVWSQDHKVIAIQYAVVRAAKPQALLSGRDYVAPDDVQAILPQTVAHRLLPVGDAGRGPRRRRAP